MSKHAVGPWRVYENELSDLFIFSGESREGAIAQAFSNSPNKKANARLIAAGPEMFEALKFYAQISKSTHSIETPELLADRGEQARAIIAKIEGES